MNKNEVDNLDMLVRWAIKDITRSYNHDVNMGCVTIACSCIDALAGYRYGVTRDNPDTGKLFVRFVKEYLINFNQESKTNGYYKRKNVVVCRTFTRTRRRPIYQELIYPEILYKHFRNGLIHERFTKFGTGLLRSDNPAIITDDDQNYSLLINLKAFVPDVISGIERFKTDVQTKTSIQKNFIKHLKFLTRK